MVRHIITRVEDSDWDQLVEIQFRAFEQELFCQLTNGQNTASNRKRVREKHIQRRAENSNEIWLKVIDADEPITTPTASDEGGGDADKGIGENRSGATILGAALYKINPSYTVDKSKRTELDTSDFSYLDDPDDRQAAVSLVHDVMDRKSRLIKEAHIQLDIVFTSPDHQRKGIGSMLLNWGVQLAKHMMLPIWVEASQGGRNMYLRHGFTDAMQCRIVVGKWDIEYSIVKWEPDQKYIIPSQ